MIHFHYKGKGLLVLVYFSVPFVVILILSGFLFPDLFKGRKGDEALMITFGISLLISGLLNYLTVDEYYTDENGEKQYVYFDNRFMFLDMKLWSYIFWIGGGLLIFLGIAELF